MHGAPFRTAHLSGNRSAIRHKRHDRHTATHSDTEESICRAPQLDRRPRPTPLLCIKCERHNTSWGDAQQCCAQLVVESSSSAENSPVRAEQTAHRFAQYKAGPLALACKRCHLSQHVHSHPLAVVGGERHAPGSRLCPVALPRAVASGADGSRLRRGVARLTSCQRRASCRNFPGFGSYHLNKNGEVKVDRCSCD